MIRSEHLLPGRVVDLLLEQTVDAVGIRAFTGVGDRDLHEPGDLLRRDLFLVIELQLILRYDDRPALGSVQQCAVLIEVGLFDRQFFLSVIGVFVQDLGIAAHRTGKLPVRPVIFCGFECSAFPGVTPVTVAARNIRPGSLCVIAVLGHGIGVAFRIGIPGILRPGITQIGDHRFPRKAVEGFCQQIVELVIGIFRPGKSPCVDSTLPVKRVRRLADQISPLVPLAVSFRKRRQLQGIKNRSIVALIEKDAPVLCRLHRSWHQRAYKTYG